LRIGVLSDTHGDDTGIKNAIRQMGEVDAIFHLGDYVRDIGHIDTGFFGKTYVVQGNCDLLSISAAERAKYPFELLITIDGKRVFATHGHRYRVKDGLNALYYRGLEAKADIVLFGHTHCPAIIKIEGMVMMNPGSISRQRNKRGSTYGIIEINDDGIVPVIVDLE
jgi:putative phosphoesterase